MFARFLFVFMLSFVIVLPSVALAADSVAASEKKIKAHPFYKSIEGETAKRTGRDLLEYLDQNIQRDPSLLAVISLWLREHSIGQEKAEEINSLYFLSYTDTLLVMAEGYRVKGDPASYRSLMQTALLNLHIFEMMGSMDAVRCQDPTSLAAIRIMVTDRIDVFQTGYRMYPRDIIDNIQKAAIQGETKSLLRLPNIDICNMGQARLYDLSRTPGMKEKTVEDSRYPGGKRTTYIAPPGYVYSPPIVPTSEWAEARKKILGEVTEEWGKRYNRFVR